MSCGPITGDLGVGGIDSIGGVPGISMAGEAIPNGNGWVSPSIGGIALGSPTDTDVMLGNNEGASSDVAGGIRSAVNMANTGNALGIGACTINVFVGVSVMSGGGSAANKISVGTVADSDINSVVVMTNSGVAMSIVVVGMVSCANVLLAMTIGSMSASMVMGGLVTDVTNVIPLGGVIPVLVSVINLVGLVDGTNSDIAIGVAMTNGGVAN